AMIWESQFWKDDLCKKAAYVLRRKEQKHWSESSLARLEQQLMLGFYAIRKLHEAAKLSSATMRRQTSLLGFPWLGKSVTKLNWHNVQSLYHFSAQTSESRDLLFLCHQFVHSFVFVVAFDDDNRADGILFTS